MISVIVTCHSVSLDTSGCLECSFVLVEFSKRELLGGFVKKTLEYWERLSGHDRDSTPTTFMTTSIKAFFEYINFSDAMLIFDWPSISITFKLQMDRDLKKNYDVWRVKVLQS